MPVPSSRSVIAPLLAAALVAGCDRQDAGRGQASPTPAVTAPAVADTSIRAPATASGPGETGQVDRSHKGAAAPTLSFADANGKPTTLAAFKGKPVLLNLWATWCGPCVKEMPTLDRAAATVTVVAVSQDLGADGQAKAARYLLEKGLHHLRLFTDPDVHFSTTMQANLPMSVLYDADGREVWRVTGGMDWSGAQAGALLAEGKS